MELRCGLKWLVVAVLVCLWGCAHRDPIVGRWVDDRVGEFAMVFRPDGTVSWDVDTDKMAKRVLAEHPGWAERVKSQFPEMEKRIRAQKGTWSKAGDVYGVRIELNGKWTDAGYFRVGNGALTTCTKEGRPAGKLKWVREGLRR